MNQHIIKLASGCQLSYRVYGQGQHSIILYHGLVGGSYLSPEAITSIMSRDITLYAIDRIGYGQSTQMVLNSISEWEKINTSFMSNLRINSADVIGISAGAPYAYAAALNKRIHKLWILCGVPAVYQNKILEHYTLDDQKAYKAFLNRSLAELQKDYVSDMQATLKHFKNTSHDYIVHTLNDILNQNCFGMAQECSLQIKEWQIPFDKLTQPVHYFHAIEDDMIPIEAAKEMATHFNSNFTELHISGEKVHIRSSIIGLTKILKYYPKKEV